ncbi:MAG: hypothetical protein LT102_09055 [Burkholderiaceae bacterium]|nr:hypothetical protein [Burkholderiaceae bacterium]
MEQNTHRRADADLVGRPTQLGEGSATVELRTTERMAVDEHGLVHGGFVFGVADYAAMLAVNDEYVVLGKAESRFLAPVRAGETVVAHARILNVEERKRHVECEVLVGNSRVFVGSFTAVILGRHVLDNGAGAARRGAPTGNS